MKFRRVFLASALAVAAIPAAALAQAPSSLAGRRPSGLPDSTAAAAAESTGRVTISGLPRTYQVARVPVPRALPATAEVHWKVVPEGSGTIISRLEGVIPPGSSDRAVTVIVGIPAKAAAGENQLAQVVFHTPDGSASSVAIRLDVALVRKLHVDMLQTMFGGRPGQRIQVPYRITNSGNATDTLHVRFDLPTEWTLLSTADTLTTIAPNTVVERVLAVTVPRITGGGSFFVGVSASRDLPPERVQIDVTGPNSQVVQGLNVASGFALATGADGRQTAVLSHSVNGPIWGSIGVQADMSASTALDAGRRYRLASLGQLPQPASVTVYGRGWRAQGGAVGGSFSEVAGMNLAGQGGALSFDNPHDALQVVVARPTAGSGADSANTPLNVGVKVAHLVGPAWLSGTATHITDEALGGRRLDALGAGAAFPNLWGGQFTTEVAARRWAEGEGLGVLGQFVRIRDSRNRLDLRGSYAPGGSSAFAAARVNASASASRGLGERGSLGMQGYFTGDNGQGGLRSSNGGVSISPQLQFGKSGVLSLDAVRRMQEARSGRTNFGLGETRMSVGARASRFGLGWGAGFGAGRVVRRVSVDTFSTPDRASDRLSGFFDVTKGTARFGSWTLSLNASSDQSNTTTLPRELVVGFGFSQLPILFYGGYGLRVTGLMQRIFWFGDRPSALAGHGEVQLELPLGFRAALTADRRPFEPLAGTGTWSTALRIGRTTSLRLPSAIRRGNRRGIVFGDVNGNGVRDPGERGLPGVILRRANEQVSTDDDGRYHFGPREGMPIYTLKVDPRSLPVGWMEPGMSTDPEVAKKVTDIGVVPTANVQVQLVVSREDLGASGKLDLSRVAVTAKDSLGRNWVAVYSPTGYHVFPALPPGRYTVDIDPSPVGVPLTLQTPPPPFVVGREREAKTIQAELATRKVKMFKATPPPSRP